MIRERNGVTWPYIPTKYARQGVPDLYVTHPYWYGHIETKYDAPLSTAQLELLVKLFSHKSPAVALRFLEPATDDYLNVVRVAYRPSKILAWELECPMSDVLHNLQLMQAHLTQDPKLEGLPFVEGLGALVYRDRDV